MKNYCAHSESVASNHCKLWQNFSDCNHVQCGSDWLSIVLSPSEICPLVGRYILKRDATFFLPWVIIRHQEQLPYSRKKFFLLRPWWTGSYLTLRHKLPRNKVPSGLTQSQKNAISGFLDGEEGKLIESFKHEKIETHQFDSRPFSLSKVGRSDVSQSSSFRTPDLTRHDDSVADFRRRSDRRDARCWTYSWQNLLTQQCGHRFS